MTDMPAPQVTPAAASAPKQTPEDVAFDREMRRFRERIAALIAFIILVLYPLGAGIVVIRYGTQSAVFSAFKDLLLIINPLLGFVVGYYFNKVTSEARAENAESTARSATQVAAQAAEARQAAEANAGIAGEKLEAAREFVDELGAAADKMGLPAGIPTTLTDPGERVDAEMARKEFLRAFDKARRALQ